MARMRTSVIIPTYHRPRELKDCIQSLLEQTVLPNEIIVVDDGDLAECPLQQECQERGILYRYHKKRHRGVTRSRNVGISLAGGDILFFLDDDVELFPDYIEEILRVYRTVTSPRVMGVGGVIENAKTSCLARKLRNLLDRFLLISGKREGRVLRSGFCVDYGTTGRPLKTITEVEFLSGGVSSYRKEVFEHFRFSEKYSGYGMGEDKDFSYRVSRKFRLVVNPRARLYHHESPRGRSDQTSETRQEVLSRARLFKDYIRKKPSDWFSFSFALGSYLFERVAFLLLFPNGRRLQKVVGTFLAIRDIIYGADCWRRDRSNAE